MDDEIERHDSGNRRETETETEADIQADRQRFQRRRTRHNTLFSLGMHQTYEKRQGCGKNGLEKSCRRRSRTRMCPSDCHTSRVAEHGETEELDQCCVPTTVKHLCTRFKNSPASSQTGQSQFPGSTSSIRPASFIFPTQRRRQQHAPFEQRTCDTICETDRRYA